MQVQISITPPIDSDTFADVALLIEHESTPCRLRVDFSTLKRLGQIPTETTLDLLLIATVVYSLDRRIARQRAGDYWTREFTVTVPVSDVACWQPASELLSECISFLTGDVWEIRFSKRTERLVVPFAQQELAFGLPAKAVSLFSGGLDSLIGVIDYLESEQDTSLILVGHHDPRIGSVFSEQQIVFEKLEDNYPDRVHPLLPWVGADSGRDTTLRSRSFLFLALGVYAAQVISNDTPVIIPENGTIALNVPLTNSRTGSCSTRTTHPHFLEQVNKLLEIVGLGTRIHNPLENKTKGECVSQCLNQPALEQIAPLTISCAKRGHTRTWVRRGAKQCGRCMPCIYRRAALHANRLDREAYGRDICTGEIDITSEMESADDFRACISFLQKHYTSSQIGELLLLNGKLDIDKLDAYADVVVRAMDEIRNLLRDKATADVKAHLSL